MKLNLVGVCTRKTNRSIHKMIRPVVIIDCDWSILTAQRKVTRNAKRTWFISTSLNNNLQLNKNTEIISRYWFKTTRRTFHNWEILFRLILPFKDNFLSLSPAHLTILLWFLIQRRLSLEWSQLVLHMDWSYWVSQTCNRWK